MKKLLSSIAIVASTLMAVSAQAQSMKEITVAYFLEWPMPFQHAKVMGTYDEALGVKVNWVEFSSGVAMSAAMASGDVHISVSQGLPPFVVATSAGQDLQLLDVAVSYSYNDNCVVASALEIDKTNARELAGKKVAVPLGTAAHYGFLKQMSHFGVNVDSMEVVQMDPPEGAAALAQGSVDMACGWGGSLNRMKEHGNILLNAAEKEKLGILVFDVTSAPADFVAENSELVSKFLKVTADANATWKAGGAGAKSMIPTVAKDAGMSEKDTERDMSRFYFPSVSEQLTAKWLGGGVQEFMKGVAQVFVRAGSIDMAKPSYAGNVNSDPLKASGM